MKSIISKIFTLIHRISVICFVSLTMVSFSSQANAQPAADFNHMKTGFPLVGAHAKVECETCHTGGLFKGTSKECAGCHTPGRRVVATLKPANHMPTTAACNTCHTNTLTFVGARFNHVGVQPKSCANCHNGRITESKPSGHIATVLACDSCHRTSSWLPAGFDHAAPLPACVTCHIAGGPGKPKPANHVPTQPSASCDSCHTGFVTFLGAKYDHVGAGVTPGTCSNCHLGGTYGAKTKTAGHIPSGNISCDTCHIATDYISFAGPTMNHAAVTATPCSTCHNGSFTSEGTFLGGAKGKTPNHPATNAECNTCHAGFQTFVGGGFDHISATPAVAGRCQQCHNGTSALGPTNSVTHTTAPGLGASCDTCHNNPLSYTSFFGNAAFTHTAAVYSICGTCHLGQSAGVVTKTPGHIPVSGMATPNACDTCHSNRVFTTGGFAAPTMNHSAVSTIACATCHNGSYVTEGTNLGGALGMKAGHVAINGAACSTCHNTTAWLPASYNHTGVTPGTCGTCHISGTNGALTMSSHVNHIQVSGNACDACHNKGFAIGAFANPTMNHTVVTSIRCDTCHDGSHTAEGTQLGGAKWKGSIPNHIPTTITGTLDCNTCHTSTSLWTSEKMNHNGITGKTGVTCVTCHVTGSTYAGRMTKMSVTHDAGGHTDCSDSGCHRPLGSVGTAYSSWK